LLCPPSLAAPVALCSLHLCVSAASGLAPAEQKAKRKNQKPKSNVFYFNKQAQTINHKNNQPQEQTTHNEEHNFKNFNLPF